MNYPHYPLSILALALVTGFSACSSMPDKSSALEQTRGRYALAQNDPQVTTLAIDELKQADAALRRADLAWTNGDASEKVDHLAYMVNQRVTIAQETAASRSAQAVTASAGAERDAMRLNLRTREADLAEQKLAYSQQSNTRKTAQLASANAAISSEQNRADQLEQQLKDLGAKQTERGAVVTLGGVLFYSGQAQLQPAGERNMMALAGYLKRNPQRTASIEGYTDNVGSDNANYDLSGHRADAVKAALVSLGVGAERLSTKAHGEEDPIANNRTAAGRQMNRRVEIIFSPRTDVLSRN